jgi:hypothetical protein
LRSPLIRLGACYCIMDFPTAWAYIREQHPDPAEHDPRCSWVQARGGILCDCHILNAEYDRRKAIMMDSDPDRDLECGGTWHLYRRGSRSCQCGEESRHVVDIPTPAVPVSALRALLQNWRSLASKSTLKADANDMQFAAVYRGHVIGKEACAKELAALCDQAEGKKP